MKKKNTSLGRGLGALIAKGSPKSTPPTTKKSTPPPTTQEEEKATPSPFQEIPLHLIDSNPYQPRMEFHEPDLKELSESIASQGLLQPIVVRQKGNRYQLIAGERRLRATQMLKLTTIQASIIQATDASSAIISLIENLQRENLNPIDESMGYASLMRDFDLTQEEVAKRVGKARTTITNSLRLLQLEQDIQGYISKSLLSIGHAKVLLTLDNPSQRIFLARRIIEEGLSVRQTEQIIQQSKRPNTLPHSTPPTHIQSAVIRDLQKQLCSHFNTKVALQHGTHKGKLILTYQGNDDLHRLLQKMGFAKSITTAA